MRGQAATEYLIILAVVVIIALIVVGVLSGFSRLAGGITEQQSQTYWAGADIGILANYRITTAGAELTLKNNKPFTLRVTDAQIGGKGSLGGENVTLAPSATTNVVVDSGATADCAKGSDFSYNVTISYTEPTSGRDFTFMGDFPLVGRCQ